MVTMGRVAALVAAAFMARAAVQIPIFKILKATKADMAIKAVRVTRVVIIIRGSAGATVGLSE